VVADVLLDPARRDGDALPLWLRLLRWAPLGRPGRASGVDRIGRDRRRNFNGVLLDVVLVVRRGGGGGGGLGPRPSKPWNLGGGGLGLGPRPSKPWNLLCRLRGCLPFDYRLRSGLLGSGGFFHRRSSSSSRFFHRRSGSLHLDCLYASARGE
jgi:hypothetical protein